MAKWSAAGLLILVVAALAGALLPPGGQTRSPSVIKAETGLPPDLKPDGPEPLIRVNLTPSGATELRVRIRGSYEIRRVGGRKPLTTGRNAAFPVAPSLRGLKLGDDEFDDLPIEIVPEQSPAVALNDSTYRGTLRLFRRTDGRVSAVNVLPIEEYLASVVDSEMPASFPDAARQAQSVVSRTYALYHAGRAERKAVFDVYATERSQKYLGYEYLRGGKRMAGESESSRRAVAQTRGLVLGRNGKLFCSYFSAVCGGNTCEGKDVFADAALLTSVPCDWCRESPHYRWAVRIPLDELKRQVPALASLPRITSIQPLDRRSRPEGFAFSDGEQAIPVTASQLRSQVKSVPLRSPRFGIRLDGDEIQFRGAGHGHGVGLCQWGARGLGKSGKSAAEILRHYYPGCDLMPGY